MEKFCAFNIVEYDKGNWGKAVVRLFAAIYPNREKQQCVRMAYDENHPVHVLKLLALKDNLPVGQINCFRVAESARLGNVGYHVHPDWRRKGVASLLLSKTLPKITHMFDDGLVVQTNESNIPGKALAIKAGFMPATEILINSYRSNLKCLTYEDGVCFHLPSVKSGLMSGYKASS